jgi:hypothetical protein
MIMNYDIIGKYEYNYYINKNILHYRENETQNK